MGRAGPLASEAAAPTVRVRDHDALKTLENHCRRTPTPAAPAQPQLGLEGLPGRHDPPSARSSGGSSRTLLGGTHSAGSGDLREGSGAGSALTPGLSPNPPPPPCAPPPGRLPTHTRDGVLASPTT